MDEALVLATRLHVWHGWAASIGSREFANLGPIGQ